ncbi:DUF4252 domain-containing protein [Maribacter sp. 1_MG-2023]|uniref:DUF4252 domain-containing protein n=1 Tax=Maribacter sp. 1_MG-2023 TaxID=3062677 RepID=UPI0026E14776|nr:DUF4252 domain-containing protein [Maribacter sp. 1_MG-2023]MDO6472088.1 DUF4252 domain-containing protein [Maribacter sp. 1_MG-2023]
MLKKIYALSALLLITSCGSYNSIDTFYNAHKNDNQVTAVRVPKFMLSMISEISLEMKAMVGNAKDLRYMQFPSATASKTQFLNQQMNGITGNSFIEVFRKNDDLKRNVVSVREKKNLVKEILIYNNNSQTGSFLYFNGDFDPAKVREMAKNEQFTKFGDNIISQFGASTPGINSQN